MEAGANMTFKNPNITNPYQKYEDKWDKKPPRKLDEEVNEDLAIK
jgi:hypothetical protein